MSDIAGRRSWRRYGGAAALLAGGACAGALLAGTLSASAADPAASSTPSATTDTPQSQRDESKPQRPDERLLTGDTASKVRAAALAKYPGATVLRVETDSDGVYEAHLVTSGGQRVTVEVNRSFAVTGTESGPGGHGGRGPGMRGGGSTPGTDSESSTGASGYSGAGEYSEGSVQGV